MFDAIVAASPANSLTPSPAPPPDFALMSDDEGQLSDPDEETILYETDAWIPDAVELQLESDYEESDDNVQTERYVVDLPIYRSPRPQRQRRLPRRYQD